MEAFQKNLLPTMPSGLDNRLDNRGFHTHLHCAVLLLPLKAVSAPKNRNSSTHNARPTIPYFSLPCQALLDSVLFTLPNPSRFRTRHPSQDTCHRMQYLPPTFFFSPPTGVQRNLSLYSRKQIGHPTSTT